MKLKTLLTSVTQVADSFYCFDFIWGNSNGESSRLKKKSSKIPVMYFAWWFPEDVIQLKQFLILIHSVTTEVAEIPPEAQRRVNFPVVI